MKRSTLILFVIILSFFLCGCGQSGDDKIQKSSKQTKSRIKKSKKEKMTVEKYCIINNETTKLLMEKYWEKFKGKKYSEVKDIYAQYSEEKEDIYKKYKIVKILSLSNFYRRYYKEVRKYKANHPEYKEYPEYTKAVRTVIDYSFKEYGQN
jgi:hypothetical protein